ESMPLSGAQMPVPIVTSPVANREAKQDRLSVMTLAQASAPPQTMTMNEMLRQAYASSSVADVEAAKAVATLPPPETMPSQSAPALAAPVVQPPKPKAARPAPQKSYSLLSDAQIAGIKDRLKLSSSQEYYWPSVETALRAVARKLNAERLSNPHAAATQLDPE